MPRRIEAVALRQRAAGLAFEGAELVAREDDAVKLWSAGMATLRSAGFEVRIAESIAKTRVGPVVTVDVRVGSEVGWLDTELEFRAGALTVEIAKVRGSARSACGQRWIALDDGTLARVADDVAVLLGDKTVRDPSLRPHQLGKVERWLALANEDMRVTVHPRTLARAKPGARAHLEAALTAEAPGLPDHGACMAAASCRGRRRRSPRRATWASAKAFDRAQLLAALERRRRLAREPRRVPDVDARPMGARGGAVHAGSSRVAKYTRAAWPTPTSTSCSRPTA